MKHQGERNEKLEKSKFSSSCSYNNSIGFIFSRVNRNGYIIYYRHDLDGRTDNSCYII